MELTTQDQNRVLGDVCKWLNGGFYSAARKEMDTLRLLPLFVSPPEPPPMLYRACLLPEGLLWDFPKTKTIPTCPGNRGVGSWTTSIDKAKAFAQKTFLPSRETGFEVIVGASFPHSAILTHIPSLIANLPDPVDEDVKSRLIHMGTYWAAEDEWVVLEDSPPILTHLEVHPPRRPCQYDWGQWCMVDVQDPHNPWWKRVLRHLPRKLRPIPLIPGFG